MIDNFNADDYNEIYIDDRQEYTMVMSAIRTQDGANFIPNIVRKVYAYGTSYLYYYDKNGKPIIVEKNISEIISETEEYYERFDKDRETLDWSDENFGNGQRNGSNGNRIFENRESSTTDDSLSDRTISAERQSNRRGNTKSGSNTNSKKEADGLTPPAFSMPESDDVKHSIGSPTQNIKLKNNVEKTKVLIAVHNLTEENLLKSLRLGGLPMPSIAIIKAQNGHIEYQNVM